MTSSLATERFSDRVANYVKFRPTYPKQLVNFMATDLGLKKESIIADIGSGTGISTALFLANENVVYGVEPNENMREAAEEAFKGNTLFHSVNGTSEKTGLSENSIDFVIAAQAFHWFQTQPTRIEFRRILKKSGYVCLIWNDRRSAGSEFAQKYEGLVKTFGTDYEKVKHTNIDEKRLTEFLGKFGQAEFNNHQDLDFEGVLGRMASSSYLPNEGQPGFEQMRSALQELFNEQQKGGKVRIDYDTKIFYSQLS